MKKENQKRRENMATLADIAAALNLNKTTVSKALNDSSDISRATKQRVLEEAERVGYTKHKRKKAPVERLQSGGRHLSGNCERLLCPHRHALASAPAQEGVSALLALSAFPRNWKRSSWRFDAVESLRHHRRDGAAGH